MLYIYPDNQNNQNSPVHTLLKDHSYFWYRSRFQLWTNMIGWMTLSVDNRRNEFCGLRMPVAVYTVIRLPSVISPRHMYVYTYRGTGECELHNDHLFCNSRVSCVIKGVCEGHAAPLFPLLVWNEIWCKCTDLKNHMA